MFLPFKIILQTARIVSAIPKDLARSKNIFNREVTNPCDSRLKIAPNRESDRFVRLCIEVA